MAPEKLTPLDWTPELVAAFVPAVERNPWLPLESAYEALHGSLCYEVRHGQQRALMAVRVQHLSGGTRAEVTGLVSDGPLFHVQALDRAAVMVADQLGAHVLGMSTMVPALARVAQRQGWVASGAILTKRLNRGNA